MTWAEIHRSGSHAIPIENLCSEAQKRLADIEQDDTDELYSFRVSGKERLWAVRLGQFARLLWWDPEHEVCPSHMRHT